MQFKEKEVIIGLLIFLVISIVFIDSYQNKLTDEVFPNDFRQITGLQTGPVAPQGLIDLFNGIPDKNVRDSLEDLASHLEDEATRSDFCKMLTQPTHFGESQRPYLFEYIIGLDYEHLGPIMKATVDKVIDGLIVIFCKKPLIIFKKIWDTVRKIAGKMKKPISFVRSSTVGRGILAVGGTLTGIITAEVVICATAVAGLVATPLVIERLELASNEAYAAFVNGRNTAARYGVEATFVLAVNGLGHPAETWEIQQMLQNLQYNPQAFASPYYQQLLSLCQPATYEKYSTHDVGDIIRRPPTTGSQPAACPNVVFLFDFSPHYYNQPSYTKRLILVAGNNFHGSANLEWTPNFQGAPGSAQFGVEFEIDFTDFCTQNPTFNGQIGLNVDPTNQICQDASFNINLNCNSPYSPTPTGTGPGAGPGGTQPGFTISPVGGPAAPVPYGPPPLQPQNPCGTPANNCNGNAVCTTSNNQPGHCKLENNICNCIQDPVVVPGPVTPGTVGSPGGQEIISHGSGARRINQYTSYGIKDVTGMPIFEFQPIPDELYITSDNSEVRVKHLRNNNIFGVRSGSIWAYSLSGKPKALHNIFGELLREYRYDNNNRLTEIFFPDSNIKKVFIYGSDKRNPYEDVTYKGNTVIERRAFSVYPHPDPDLDDKLDVVEVYVTYPTTIDADTAQESRVPDYYYYVLRDDTEFIEPNLNIKIEIGYIKIDDIPYVDYKKLYENNIYRGMIKYAYSEDGKLIRMMVYDANNQLVDFEQFTYTTPNQPIWLQQRLAYIFLPLMNSWQLIIFSGGLYPQHPWATLEYDIVTPSGMSIVDEINKYMSISAIPFI